jgi:hypothetical protein
MRSVAIGKPIESADDLEKCSSPRLRIGLLIDGLMQPAWVNKILSEIKESQIAELRAIVIRKAAAGEGTKRSPLARWRSRIHNRHLIPYTLFSRFDEYRHLQRNNPFQIIDISPHTEGCDIMVTTPRETKFSDELDESTLGALNTHNLDVILRFGFRILRGEILNVPTFGVWSYHHGDNSVNRGGPAGFWEVVHGDATTGATLQVLTEELDGGIIIARSASSTNRTSVAANRANHFWQASALMPRELRRLYATRKLNTEFSPDRPKWLAYTHPLYTRPGPGQMIKASAQIAGRLVRGKLHKLLRREQWIIGYKLQAPPWPSNVPYNVFHGFKYLRPPRDRYWADPFPICVEGRFAIFIEEHLFDAQHGHISLIEMNGDGSTLPPRPILSTDYHLSYPFVFKWREDWYMIPETLTRRAVELFRATRFPEQWEYLGPLIRDVDAVDATVAEIGGQWFLFAGIVVPGANEAAALNVYSAPTPLGPWIPHAHNPVKIDVRGARPAGRLFEYDGHWYRPGQMGAPQYGSGIVMHRLERLTPSDFSESVVSQISPHWRNGYRGVHTINAAGALTVIDVLQDVTPWER